MSYSLGMSWQSANIQAAASYLRERINAGDSHSRTKAIYKGLLDVLDPTRRVTRVQREMAAAKAAAAVAVKAERDRRAAERRRGGRRKVNLGSPTGVERRKGERRTSHDRRNR
ncbi:MAG: hypothetical protein HY047_14505 [Acidobacteria bacterium]|nr:hypothetical protein [Acidobacteriota bacterium]